VLLAGGIAVAGDSTVLGDGVTLDTAVSIPEVLASPDEYVGSKIRVDGVVTGVCKKRGCWMQVTDPDSGQGIRIKVEDGVIVFPHSAMGHKASAEGVLEAIKLTPEQLAQVKAQHEATARGEATDCDSEKPAEGEDAKTAKKDTGCAPEVHGDMVYMINGTGAVIDA
jgi:hypothetical protein